MGTKKYILSQMEPVLDKFEAYHLHTRYTSRGVKKKSLLIVVHALHNGKPLAWRGKFEDVHRRIGDYWGFQECLGMS